ncbi:heterokaryon incompatibility protein-domain-containing protein [Bisporella sp. PMI_857]|nr:heterokaryon incompatibility protein-domain-containing protein [Bisporella sp. PMI_857]
MLCKFCANIDLDQVATEEGYKHHKSVKDLLESAKNGCESCGLIRSAQRIEFGGDLDYGYDRGDLDTQITCRAYETKRGDFIVMRYGQDTRYDSKFSGSRPAQDIETSFLWAFLDVAAEEDNPVSELISNRKLGKRVPEERLALASMWLEGCLASHGRCSPMPHENIRSPTRVIDVGSSDGSRDPFLYTSNRDVTKWVTLSHCWGNVQPLKTTIDNIASHQAGMPLGNLPRLFQDAIRVVRALGLQYLWIDSICIIQDSKEDWESEVSRMGDIYKHCLFMISAEFCHDHTETIFNQRNTKRYVVQGCQSVSRGFQDTFVAYCGSIHEEAEHGILSSRAWALQEQILSPRTLKWAHEQLFWECRCTAVSEECARPSSLSDVYRLSLTRTGYMKRICLSNESFRLSGFQTPLSLWYAMVWEFSSRSISYTADALPAVSGIAREVARHTGFRYRAGLWLEDFHSGLLWWAKKAGCSFSDAGPTWSWASIRYGSLASSMDFITIYGDCQIVRMNLSKVISIDITHASNDEFSRITMGRLHMDGPCRPVKSIRIDSIHLGAFTTTKFLRHNAFTQYESIPTNTAQFTLDGEVPADAEPIMILTELANEGIILLQIARVGFRETTKEERKQKKILSGDWLLSPTPVHPLETQALILQPTVVKGEYRRIGLARLSDDLATGWENQTVTII